MEKVYIIAEIGVNHNGDIKLAKRLMLSSKRVGADSVKFQTYDANEIVIKGAKKANYQITKIRYNFNSTSFDLNFKDREKKTHLDPKEWNELIKKKDTYKKNIAQFLAYLWDIGIEDYLDIILLILCRLSV